MRAALSLMALVALTACASPAERMTVGQVSTLTDAQLCQMSNVYRAEPKTMTEIGHRGLNCTPASAECMARGVPHGSPQMLACVALVHAEWEAAYYTASENARRDYAMYQLGTEANTQHIYINQ